jgi:NAD(P)-dependent dehydrogenase (short-subunit alcohol dehydrogenase family)
MDLGLNGRNAVISGGSTGIGKAVAISLAREGANVVLLARTKETLEEAANDVSAVGDGQVIAISTDVMDMELVNAAAEEVAEKLSTVHILVNSAGHRMRRMDRQILWNDEDWMGDINHKLIGMLRVIRSFLPHMATDGTGTIINISGVASSMIFHGALTHGLNNAAMQHSTGYMAKDLAGDKIRVNTVVPGLVATEWRHGWAGMMAEKSGKTKEEFLSDYCEKMGIITGRWAGMEEIADAVAFLASDRASYFNAMSMVIDGGMLANPR